MEYATWLRRQLAYLDAPPTQYVGDDLAIVIAEAKDRAAKAGLPGAVKACQIRSGPVGVELARLILTVCLRDAIDHDTEGKIEPDPERPLTVREAARLLNVAPRTVYDLVESGRLEAQRIGKGRGTIRITRQAVEGFQNPAPPQSRRPLKHL